MKMTGAKIFLESLLKEGVDTIFGFPGGAVLPIYDVLYDAPIRHILARHEQGATHAADGYARATGKPGICLVTSGPGATNTVTGIATAYMDSIPIIVFTGQVPTALIGNDAFQEADIVGITRPCTKHSYLVKDVRDLAKTIKEAFYIATTGNQGPVLIDLPKDVLNAETKFEYPGTVNMRSYKPTVEGHIRQIKRMADEIARSKRPVIYAGGGVILSNASEELVALAKNTQIPVTTTLMGLGCFPSTGKLSLGMCGMHGTFRSNMAITEADLLIAIGARFDDRVTGKLDEFSVKSRKIQIDIDPTSIGKNVRVDLPVVGDIKNVLKKLNSQIKQTKKDWTQDTKPWLRKIEKWKRTFPLAYKQGKSSIKPQYVIEQIAEITKGDAIYVTDVGQHQMWAAQYLNLKKPRTFLTSGGLGTMGYGFPAGIGAQAAFPKKAVFVLSGDGSFQMNLQELITAVQHQLPVKVAIINNGFLGMVRQWQQLFYDKRYSHVCMASAPDFVKLAESYGALGLRAKKPDEVKKTIEKALAYKGPVVIDFVVAKEENVYPMVPAGKGIHEMLLV
ncbi:MAG TPA: biosynthetic-type acetolactate synthase large subunit [Nitrospinota bacterium]|jgi:acetolactate synthase-1/2/3 large subunit|nr:biosynthetic-type acetolactate synthase large subunit [Nitrospinota bacterium]|tara:strand:+ start:97 stop:1782 length:1686 start_codon:yes stop_codon:yes gene_type:complete